MDQYIIVALMKIIFSVCIRNLSSVEFISIFVFDYNSFVCLNDSPIFRRQMKYFACSAFSDFDILAIISNILLKLNSISSTKG